MRAVSRVLALVAVVSRGAVGQSQYVSGAAGQAGYAGAAAGGRGSDGGFGDGAGRVVEEGWKG